METSGVDLNLVLAALSLVSHNKWHDHSQNETRRVLIINRSHLMASYSLQGEKIAFIMDESNIKDSGFLERMNTLLANGEVPGLFEGDEYTTLMTQCKEGAQRMGQMLDSSEELYKWFTQQVTTE